jgi:endogenous inhibitor of DNA gyrase (YacG/DUF329 family)
MLIARADFLDAILDLDGREVEVRAHDEVAAKCPGCGHALHRAELVVNQRAVPPDVSACADHGVWFDAGVLEAVLAELSHRASARTTMTPSRFVPGWANASAFRGGRLAHHAPAARPSVHTPLPSAHTGRALACPECQAPLVRSGMAWICTAHGALVEEVALDAMIGEMTGAPWAVPAWTNTAGTRKCPACAAPMTVESLGGRSLREGRDVARSRRARDRAREVVGARPQELGLPAISAAGLASRAICTCSLDGCLGGT